MMKNKNIIIIITLAVLAFFNACDKEPDLRMPNVDDMITDAVAYVTPNPDFPLDFLPGDAANFEGGFTIDIPYENVASVDVNCFYYNGLDIMEIGNLSSVSSFPSELTIDINDVLGMFSTLGTTNDIMAGMSFLFYANVHTLDGGFYQMYLDDGRVNVSPDIQTQPGASMNTWYKTLCDLVVQNFLGAVDCYEEGYGTYPVNFTQDPVDSLRIYNDNFWDWAAPGSLIYYDFSGDIDQMVDVPFQAFTFGDGTVGSVEGSGKYDACTGTFWTNTDVEYGGGIYGTYHEFTPSGSKSFVYYKGKKADLMK